jgi:hypothetical protein
MARKPKPKPRGTKRVVEEFCRDADCPERDHHWHPLSVESFLKEDEGEYDVLIRVREVL